MDKLQPLMEPLPAINTEMENQGLLHIDFNQKKYKEKETVLT